VENGKDSIK